MRMTTMVHKRRKVPSTIGMDRKFLLMDDNGLFDDSSVLAMNKLALLFSRFVLVVLLF